MPFADPWSHGHPASRTFYQNKIDALYECLQECRKDNLSLQLEFESVDDESARLRASNNILRLRNLELKKALMRLRSDESFQKDDENKMLCERNARLKERNETLEKRLNELEKENKHLKEEAEKMGREEDWDGDDEMEVSVAKTKGETM